MVKLAWYQRFDRDFDKKHLREWRCSKCHKLLAMEYVHSGNIAIKCQCGELNRLMFRTAPRDTINTATPAGGTNNNKSKKE